MAAEEAYLKQVVKSYPATKRKHVRYKKAVQLRENQQKAAAHKARIKEQNQARLLTLSNEVKRAKTFLDSKTNAVQAILAFPNDPQSSRSVRLTKLELKNTSQAYGTKVGQYDAAIIDSQLILTLSSLTRQSIFTLVKPRIIL